MAKFVPPEDEEERRAWIKRQKAKGVRAFKARYGWVASTFGPPSNPRTADQQRHRQNILAASRRWRTLSLDQQGSMARACGQHILRKRRRQAGAT